MLPAMRSCILCNEQPNYVKPNGDKSRLCKLCRNERERMRAKGKALPPIPPRERKCGGICIVDGCEIKAASDSRTKCSKHGWHGKNGIRLNQYQKDRRDSLKWGLPDGTFNTILEFQDWTCPICKTPFSEFDRQPDFDHEHESKLFRGLACGRCNRTILGLVENNMESVLRAIEYLKNPPAQQVWPGIKITKERDRCYQ